MLFGLVNDWLMKRGVFDMPDESDSNDQVKLTQILRQVFS